MVDIADLKNPDNRRIIEALKLKDNRKRLEDTFSEDLSFEEFGGNSNFVEIEELKKDLSNYLADLLDMFSQCGDELDLAYAEQYLRPFSRIISKVNEINREVKSQAELGIHRPEFEKTRTNLIDQMRVAYKEGHATLGPFYSLARTAELERVVGSGALNAAKDEYEEAKAYAEKSGLEIQNILDSLRSGIGDKTAESAESEFSSLATIYGDRERNWFIGLSIGVVLLVLTIYNLFEYTPEPSTATQALVFEGLRKFLLISMAIAVIRICLTKYNTERHLRIIYDHRAKAIEQFMVFQNSIPESDGDARSALRLEMARVVFSDPQTAYTGGGSKSELNINPIVSAAESVIKKSTG